MCTSFVVAPARHPKREDFLCSVALTYAQPRSTDAIEWGVSGKAPTATGESRDGERGQWAQFDLGSGGTQGTATWECESTECRTHDEELGKGDAVRPEPAPYLIRSPGVSTWEAASRGERPGRDVIITDRRVSGTYGPVIRSRTVDMRNRMERQEHSEPALSVDKARDALRPKSPRVRNGVRGSNARPLSTVSRCGKRFVSRWSLSGEQGSTLPTVHRGRPFGEQGSTLCGRFRAQRRSPQVSMAGNTGKA